MNTRLEKVYKNNKAISDSLVGLKVVIVYRELYYFDNKLVAETMGDLKFVMSDGRSILLTCDADSESIKIVESDFEDRPKMQIDFKDLYKWTIISYMENTSCSNLGDIILSQILCFKDIQCMLKLKFRSGTTFYFEVTSADNVKYFLIYTHHEVVWE